MPRQTFTVAFEMPALFEEWCPTVEAGMIASIVRDGIISRSCSFMGPVPFTIICECDSKVALASGQMREFSPQELGEPQPCSLPPARE